jgi:hypothetical protein
VHVSRACTRGTAPPGAARARAPAGRAALGQWLEVTQDLGAQLDGVRLRGHAPLLLLDRGELSPGAVHLEPGASEAPLRARQSREHEGVLVGGDGVFAQHLCGGEVPASAAARDRLRSCSAARNAWGASSRAVDAAGLARTASTRARMRGGGCAAQEIVRSRVSAAVSTAPPAAGWRRTLAARAAVPVRFRTTAGVMAGHPERRRSPRSRSPLGRQRLEPRLGSAAARDTSARAGRGRAGLRLEIGGLPLRRGGGGFDGGRAGRDGPGARPLERERLEPRRMLRIAGGAGVVGARERLARLTRRSRRERGARWGRRQRGQRRLRRFPGGHARRDGQRGDGRSTQREEERDQHPGAAHGGNEATAGRRGQAAARVGVAVRPPRAPPRLP